MVAKRAASTYAAGKRNGAWIKIKRRLKIQAAIIGFIEKPGKDFQCLLVAGSGLPGGGARAAALPGEGRGGLHRVHASKNERSCERAPPGAPLVACPERALWVEPGLYCEVSFAELTEAGLLRAPVFEGLIEE